MKCQSCSQEVKLWQTFCPRCGNRLQNKSYSTIAEMPVTPEQQSRRKLLRQTLQFALLAVTVILLASVIRLSPPQANPLPKDSAAANVAATTTSTPTPVPVVTAPSVPVPTPAATPIPSLKPIDLLGDVRDLTALSPSPTPAPRRAVEAVPKARPVVHLLDDEVPPKKVLKPVVQPVPVVAQVKAPEPVSPEVEPNLEMEAGQTLLAPNTGLVTIKSYVRARVYIDGAYSGVTPRSVKLLAGDHNISLMAEGYHEYTRTVKVGGQQQTGIFASMSKK